jgi:hypothetical protein
MNHQPTILKYLTLVIIIGGLSLTSNSQTPPYVTLNTTTTGNKLSIVVPTDMTTRLFSEKSLVNPPDNYYSIWLEKGDGNYLSTFSNGLDDIPAGRFSNPPYLLASKLYEHGTRPPPPPSSGSTSNNTPAITGPETITSPLSGSSNKIILFSNVREIVANDTMVFGISYSPNVNPQNASGKYKVMFRYNTPEAQMFIPIASGTSGIIPTYNVPDYSNNSSISLPYIRKYHDEDIRLDGFSDTELYSYSNAIAFDNINESNSIFNIFISLIPLNDLPVATSIEAVIYYQNNKGDSWTAIDSSKIENMVSLEVHDPNSISVSPKCLSLPQTTQKLHYSINFQNTGEGNADAVKVAFYFPPQTNRTNRTINLEHLKIAYSGFQELAPAEPEYDLVNGRIIFTLELSDPNLLYGTKEAPDPVTNPKTMGQISFDLEILPGTDVNQSAILDAWAEIYLRGESASLDSISLDMISRGLFMAGTSGFEKPVRTNNAITLFSNCSTVKPVCKCSHPKGIWQWLCCYWWIIVIILLIFVIWWMYKTKRRHG